MQIFSLKKKKTWFPIYVILFFINVGGWQCIADPQLDPSLALKGGFLGDTKIMTSEGSLTLEQIYQTMARGEDVLVHSVPENDALSSSPNLKKITCISYYRPKHLSTITLAGSESTLLASHDQALLFKKTSTIGEWVIAQALQKGQKLGTVAGSHHDEQEVFNISTVKNTDNLIFYSLAVEDHATYVLADHDLIAHNFNPLSWFPAEAAIHSNMVNASFLAGIATFTSLMLIKAPYGRHIKEGWGPTIPNKWGWILMEIPSVLAFAGTYALGGNSLQTAPLLLAGIWLSHYCYRTFIFPNLIRSSGKKMPLSIAMTGFAYNTFNSYLNARWISHLGTYPSAWSSDPRFILGSMIFASGLALNIHSDQILINLRQPGETGYKIPAGGGFNYVSAPNYLGELIEWTGWAIASWSLPGLSFAMYTGANLIPRALANHKWYQEKFPEYPEDRKAIIPKVL